MNLCALEDFAARPCPSWFATPQLGIFIHWGLYSVPAFAPRGRSIHDLLRDDYEGACAHVPYAEWYANAMRIPGSATEAYHQRGYGDAPYADFRGPFDAASQAFDADNWADLFAQAGAGYVVFVTKHHDGYCLWPTEVANPHRPGWHSERDFVGELAAAVRARGIHFGVYYSGGLDWTFHHEPIRNIGDMLAGVPIDDAYRAYAAAQMRELIDRYQPSILWNDIGWPDDRDLPALFDYYYRAVPDGVVNDRWAGDASRTGALQDPANRATFNAMVKASIAAGGSLMSPPRHADFRTIEYGLGTPPEVGAWEACRGVGLSFGYNRAEQLDDYLTPVAFAAMRNETMAAGGNLLINIGPMADGSISVEQVRVLVG
jgi:alpha-L-fucosidase